MNYDYLALFTRYLWEEKNWTIVHSSSPQLSKSMEVYNERFGIEAEDGEVRHMVLQMLHGCALVAEAQVENDSWGWTLRMPGKCYSIFCGVEPKGNICACVERRPGLEIPEDDAGRLVVQRISEQSPLRQSNIQPFGESVEDILMQFYLESEQIPAAFSLVGDESLLFVALPNADYGALGQRNAAGRLELFRSLLADGKLKEMHERVYYYGCHCNEKYIRRVVEVAASHNPEIWGDDGIVDTHCSRCKRSYRLHKNNEL